MRQKEITFIPIKLLSLEDEIWTIYFYWSILKELEREKENLDIHLNSFYFNQ